MINIIFGITVGDVIAALCKYASEEDRLLMAKDVESIYVSQDGIEVIFVDGNTPDITIPI